MIEAHTLDAWTRVDDRSSAGFRYLTLLGGFAAPLFLWLAGISLVLAADSRSRRSGNRHEATLQLIKRGLEVLVLAFLFRLQALVVTPGGPLITFFRVDILNVMGPSIAAAGVVWALTRHRGVLAALYAFLAVLAAMLTPVIREASWVDRWPTFFQWYLKPAGEHTTFTLFPWTGFVFAGAAVGVALAAARGARSEKLTAAGLAVAGAALIAPWIHVEVVYGYASWPLRHRLRLWQTMVAWAIFCAMMYAAVGARDRVLAVIRSRQSGRSPFARAT